MDGIRLSSLAAILCLVAVSATSCTANHVKEMYELAFAMNGEPLGPENTFELLKSLEASIETDSLGRKLKKELPKIIELIEVGKTSQEKCNLENVKHVADLYDHNIEFATNIAPYIEFYRLRQFEVCKEIFAANLKKAFTDLPLEAQTAADLIKNTYLEANQGSADKMRYLRVEDPILKEALVLYLGRQPFELITKEKVKGAKGEEVFKRIFDHTVTEMCGRINDGLKSEYELYRHLLGDEEIVKQVDDETLGWITVYRICSRENNHWKFFGDMRKMWLKMHQKFWGDL